MDSHSITQERIFVQVGPGRWLVTEAEPATTPAPAAARPAGLLQVIKWLIWGRF